MKNKDMVVIIAIAFISAIFSFVIAQYVFGGEKSYKLTARKIDAISSDFKQPSVTYFNVNSINLTKDITISGSTNQAPFK